MVKRKEIKAHIFKNEKDWFQLNSTPRKYASRYFHEVAGADLFVAYFNYASKWFVEYKLKDDRADRGMDFEGKRIYFEVDMCTENIQVLYEKVENAIAYADETKNRFHTVFVFCGEEKEVFERGKKLLLFLATKRRGDQFTITNHSALIANPLGDVLVNPKTEIKSLSTML